MQIDCPNCGGTTVDKKGFQCAWCGPNGKVFPEAAKKYADIQERIKKRNALDRK